MNTQEKRKRKRQELNKAEPWRHRLQDIRNRCNSPINKRYKNYGGRGIECFLTLDNLKFMWFRDKAYELNFPTVDRKDNNGNYELPNCQFIERHINSKKDKGRPVLQITKEGKTIKEWFNIRTASKNLSIVSQNIYETANNKRKSAGGYVWRYKNGQR